MRTPKKGADFRLAELVLHLPADWPLTRDMLKKPAQSWPIVWLGKIAAYPHEHNTWLGGPVTVIANGDPPQPLGPGCPFAALLLASSYDGIGPIQTQDGRLIQLYTLMPLYAEERQLELSQGLAELFRRFDAQGVSKVVDVRRPNVALSKAARR
jgi:hypothetical protein